MAPRLPAAVSNSIFNLTSLLQSLPSAARPGAQSQCSACLFSTTAPLEAKRAKKRKVRKHLDPYRAAQARQRKSANLARRKELMDARQAALGDPVRSRPTPFVQSLRSHAPNSAIAQSYLNYFLKPDDMQKALTYSKWLTEPIPGKEWDGTSKDITKDVDRHAEQHENAAKALLTISALENGNSKDRTRVNIQRCVEEFGRHNTDTVLPPRLQSKQAIEHQAVLEARGEAPVVRKRVGADTGSSEVQIAVLTTKINVLADNLHKKDKHNKRNLRLLVHRRQKLLNYLRRQDRGGPRWQNLVEKLGINDAMWKGEISM